VPAETATRRAWDVKRGIEMGRFRTGIVRQSRDLPGWSLACDDTGSGRTRRSGRGSFNRHHLGFGSRTDTAHPSWLILCRSALAVSGEGLVAVKLPGVDDRHHRGARRPARTITAARRKQYGVGQLSGIQSRNPHLLAAVTNLKALRSGTSPTTAPPTASFLT